MLPKYEQETIINFNKEEKTAYIFTYEKTWQKHLEGKLGLKPTLDNGKGGKGYEVDKKRIKVPRAPRKATKRNREVLAKACEKRKSSVTTTKSEGRNKKQ